MIWISLHSYVIQLSNLNLIIASSELLYQSKDYTVVAYSLAIMKVIYIKSNAKKHVQRHTVFATGLSI